MKTELMMKIYVITINVTYTKYLGLVVNKYLIRLLVFCLLLRGLVDMHTLFTAPLKQEV